MAHPVLKRLERAFRALVRRVVIGVIPRRRLTPPDWGARPHRVLYLRYDRIGDMLMMTGLLRAIAGSHRSIELDVLASRSNACVLEGNPHVGRVLIFDRRRRGGFLRVVRELRRRHYDAVIDGNVVVPSITAMLLMLATGAPYRIGVSGLAQDAIYTLPVPPGPPDALVLLQAAQTAIPFGVRPEQTDWRYELFLREDELARAEAVWRSRPGRPRILVNVSAFTPDRRWPWDRFAAVIRHLRQAVPAARVLVVGDPRDWSAVSEVASAGGAEPVYVAPVREAFALVARADALYTPDTSLAHAAAATGTPVAVMFRGDWLVNAPYGARLVSIVSDGPTLADLPVGRALAAMNRLLELAATPPSDPSAGGTA